MGIITSKSFTECYARNLRPETWRWWLSGCPRKHLFFVPSTGKRWPNKSTHLLQRHFERPWRGILDGERHRFSAFHGSECHDEHVSQQSLLEILAIFASNGPPVHLMGRITVEDFCQIGAGGSLCVGAHLPTVDENFRTYRQWRTYSIYRIEADDAITWYHSLSRFGSTRCRRARKLVPCRLFSPLDFFHLEWWHVSGRGNTICPCGLGHVKLFAHTAWSPNCVWNRGHPRPSLENGLKTGSKRVQNESSDYNPIRNLELGP